MDAEMELRRALPLVQAQLEKELARYPRSLAGIKRLERRDPFRFLQWQAMQLKLTAIAGILAKKA